MLLNTYCKLTGINVQEVLLVEGYRDRLMVLTLEERVRGYSGCNRFSGSFFLDQDRLEFDELMSTRMACARGMQEEARFLAELGGVTWFRVVGEHLTLLDIERRPVLTFESVYLP